MAAEYRIVWRREGTGKRTKLFQRRDAAERYCEVLKGNAPLPAMLRDRDPDEFWCCPGTSYHECGCRGITVAQAIADHARRQQERYENVPPLILGPVIETREVGEWSSSILLEHSGEEGA